MDNLEIQKQVIQLGKLIVEELDLEPGTDTLSKWMSFYLAEKIKKTETLSGIERDSEQSVCFDIILKLWKHRWTFPHGRRPLENFEPILNFLQKLNPDKDDPYFFPLIPDNYREETKEKPREGSAEFWMLIAEQIDKSARISLDAILKLAAEAASDDKTAEWLKNSVDLPDSHDTHILRIIVEENTLSVDEHITDRHFDQKYKIQQLNNRISHLQKLIQFSDFLIAKYREDLQTLKKRKAEDDDSN